MHKVSPFIIFLTIFLTLYGSLHLYFYRKLIKAIELNLITNLLLLIVLCFPFLSPILMRLSATNEYPFVTYTLTYIGYIWMAILFLFFSSNILIDMYSIICHILARIVAPIFLRYIPGDKVTFLVTVVVIIGILVYGRYEAENITVRKSS